MITGRGDVKILDFGLAKLTDPGAALSPNDVTEGPATAQTEAGVILGTVAYMSPEQADGRQVDARSDVFSFGSLLYEIVTGRQAFEGSRSCRRWRPSCRGTRCPYVRSPRRSRPSSTPSSPAA